MVQYSLMPSQVNETFRKRTMTDTYIYAAGTYLLNEKWSLNGSVMKSVTPKSVRTNSPLSPPTEAMHFGVDYRITPHVTVGAKIGYSNGSNTFKQSYFPY
jgi:long-subunit fatty acid transport protein